MILPGLTTRVFVLFLVLVFQPLNAFAAETGAAKPVAIEAVTFRMETPEGWNVEEQKPASHGLVTAKYRGPNGELLLISFAVLKPDAAMSEAMSKEAEEFWRKGIEQALVAGAGNTDQPALKVTEPFNETTLNGKPFLRLKAEDAAQNGFFTGYGIIGPGATGIMVTVEGFLKDKPQAEAAVEAMLKTIVWKR